MKTRRVLLGTVGVDSSQIMVMDPYHLEGVTTTIVRRGMCDQLPANSTEYGGATLQKFGDDGLVVTLPGLVDGTYNVYATVVDFDRWGERVARLEIELMSDEDVRVLEAMP